MTLTIELPDSLIAQLNERQIPEDERVLQAWRLSLELSQLRGDPPHEPGLRRPVTRIQRR